MERWKVEKDNEGGRHSGNGETLQGGRKGARKNEDEGEEEEGEKIPLLPAVTSFRFVIFLGRIFFETLVKNVTQLNQISIRTEANQTLDHIIFCYVIFENYC